MSHVSCPWSDGCQAYSQAFSQCSKPQPFLVLYRVHNGETSFAYIQRVSFAYFVTMGYSCWEDNQIEAMPVDKCFSFGLLLVRFFFLVISYSSATVNSSESNALRTDGSLTQFKEDTASDGRYILFIFRSYKLCKITSISKFLSAQIFQPNFLYNLAAHSFSFPWNGPLHHYK
jgi:hypothetical protein